MTIRPNNQIDPNSPLFLDTMATYGIRCVHSAVALATRVNNLLNTPESDEDITGSKQVSTNDMSVVHTAVESLSMLLAHFSYHIQIWCTDPVRGYEALHYVCRPCCRILIDELSCSNLDSREIASYYGFALVDHDESAVDFLQRVCLTRLDEYSDLLHSDIQLLDSPGSSCKEYVAAVMKTRATAWQDYTAKMKWDYLELTAVYMEASTVFSAHATNGMQSLAQQLI